MKRDILIDLDAKFNQFKQTKEQIITESIAEGNTPAEVVARIDLVEKFNLSQSVVDKMTTDEILAEYDKQLETPKKIDTDAVLTEWSWRCDKGYPDFNNKADRIKLQEVLDEMNIPLPFKRISEASGDKKSATKATKPAVKSSTNKYEGLTKREAKFMQLVNGEAPDQPNNPDIPDTVKKSLLSVFRQFPKKQKTWIEQFQQIKNVNEFVAAKGEPWREFFDCIAPSGMGRGEMMAVMAINGAKSGGTAEKDLKVPNGKPWEVKEDPTGIRMAQSGFAGRFRYINELRKFYELLNTIELNDSTKDSILKANLVKVFGNEATANSMYQILTTNFRGDGYKVSEKDKKAAEKDGKPLITKDNFFERMIAAAEYPTGVINLHYLGFKQLQSLRGTIISQKELVNNAKLVLRTAGSDDDIQYYISAKDAAEIQSAGEKGKEARIKVTTSAKKDSKELPFVDFLHAMLQIVRHPFVKNPEEIIEDFVARKMDYFSHIQGFVYYLKRDATPRKGFAKDFVIYGISQSQGKMESKEYASGTEFIKAQLGR